MELRPYQEKALSQIMEAMRGERFILAQAATGAGKTILFSAIIKLCMEQYRMRIGILAHREILVRQAKDKLLKVWPGGSGKVGVMCASVGKPDDPSLPVIIASPQTLVRRVDKMPPLDLVIIDECHRVPPKDVKSQYGTLIERMEDAYPKLRVLGVTATPYRLGHGYIYGGENDWFEKLHTRIGIADLQEEGWLVPLRAKQAEDISGELRSVKKSAGEFNMGQLEAVMTRQVHLDSAVSAFKQYGESRAHVAVFCTTIQHAEMLCAAFEKSGISAAVVHSEMPAAVRHEALADFEAGRVRVICNVGVLTEGWDCPFVDCLMLCRPTMSPALYVQMVGRGLRTAEGKSDCLLLDLSGNCQRHGDPDHPFVEKCKSGKDDGSTEEQQTKVCPNPQCKEIMPRTARVCPQCGHVFTVEAVYEEAGDVVLVDAPFGSFKADVMSWNAFAYTSKAGNRMMRLSMLCKATHSAMPLPVSVFLDFEGTASEWGQKKALRAWIDIAGTRPPETVDEAIARKSEMHPEACMLEKRGKYYNVTRWR